MNAGREAREGRRVHGHPPAARARMSAAGAHLPYVAGPPLVEVNIEVTIEDQIEVRNEV